MIPRLSLLTAALAAAVLWAARASQDPPVEPPPAVQSTSGADPARGREGLTREKVLGRLDAIERAAERLAELVESEEARSLAERIRWLAKDLGDSIESSMPAPAPDDAPGSAPAELTVDLPPSGKRADPRRWLPVQPRQQVFKQWGVNPKNLPPGGTTNRVFAGVHFRSVSKGGAVMSTFNEPHRNFTFSDCLWEGAPGDDGRIRTRWGIRAFDVIDWRFLHCEWRNIPQEHGTYLSAPGSVLWRQCRFQEIGSQAIQVVFRTGGKYAHETSNPALRNLGGLHHVQECLFLEVGKPTGSRPSYALSFFGGPLCAVRIESCFIQTLNSPHLDHQGMPASSYGAIMVHDRPRVEVLNTYVNYKQPDRDVIQIWNVDEVVIEGCEIVAGVVELRNCKRVRVANNSGGAILRVGTGPRNTWPLPNVQHEGPINKDFEQ